MGNSRIQVYSSESLRKETQTIYSNQWTGCTLSSTEINSKESNLTKKKNQNWLNSLAISNLGLINSMITHRKRSITTQAGFMNLGKITVITPPDKLFNLNLSYLLVKPSIVVKEQFQTILSQSIDDLNVFIYDSEENDISWLLSVAHQVDVVIIDIDSCDYVTKQFVTFMLAQGNVHYITNDEITPYGLISKNRIYSLEQIVERLDDEEEDDDDESKE